MTHPRIVLKALRDAACQEARPLLLVLLPATVILGSAVCVFGVFFPAAPPPVIIWIVYVGSDLLAAIGLACALVAMQRRNWLGAMLAATIPTTLVLASSAKLIVLGTPALFEDALLLPDLLETLPHWQKAGVILPSAAIAAAFLLNLSHPRRLTFGLLPLTIVAAVLLPVLPHGSRFALSTEWLPRRTGDFPFYGHVLNAIVLRVQETEMRHWARREPSTPGERMIPTIHDGLPPGLQLTQRNLHVIIIESFMDPLTLPGFAWPEEPLTDLFSRWRRESGSTSLSPVFGNRSSNAEFEVLCGLPAAESSSVMVFMRIRDGARLNCLPRLLSERGFAALSVVPSNSSIFGAARAFPAMGFVRSLYSQDLDMSYQPP